MEELTKRNKYTWKINNTNFNYRRLSLTKNKI